eukprot:TRINITY_DN2887_c0_g1_i1.p1 TRINITY_DN2887_c0_g1~~TRINITY_DN2887_c0_g1_i1.p1  ORF type:complete len:326 (-),score=47.05 TRINITY_DN2887_c0_g1_i1:97-1014(-)
MGAALPCSRDPCAGLAPLLRRGSRAQTSTKADFVGQRVSAERPSDSDHNALVFTFGEFRLGGETLRILCWNILCRFGYNAEYDFPFDGFNRRFEADEAYEARLRRIAAEVRDHCEAWRPQGVVLQECPEPGEFGYAGWVDHLTKCLKPLGYTVLFEGEFVTAMRPTPSTAVMPVPLPVLRRQSGKLHAVRIGSPADIAGGLVLLNVHLNWDKDGSAQAGMTKQDVRNAARLCANRYPGARVLLAGDTNRVLAGAERTDPIAATIEDLASGLGKLIRPPGPTNVRWNGAARKSEMTYADFALLFDP